MKKMLMMCAVVLSGRLTPKVFWDLVSAQRWAS